jgi:hypothetical protein
MRRALVCLVALVATAAANAAPIVLNFDDLNGFGSLPTNYGGLTWSSNWNYYEDFQPPYNPASPTQRTYINFLSGSGSFDFPEPVQFLGASFAGFDFEDITFDLFLDGNYVGSSATLNPTGTPTFLSSGYTGAVDRVVVNFPAGGYAVMDDVTFQAVPEPISLLVFGGLIVGGGLVARKRLMGKAAA